MRSEDPILSFGLPDGRLALRAADLSLWAEHLTWCYRLMGVRPGATIGIVDYGTSPAAFLGSRLLMPLLDAGVAERLPGRIVCLDASRERVALVPSLLKQLRFDVLVVREEVAPVLASYCREAGQALDDVLIVTALGELARHSDEALFPRQRFLLLIEDQMLIAPQCPACGRLHLWPSLYAREKDSDAIEVRPTGARATLPRGLAFDVATCAEGSDDLLIRLAEPGSQPWER